MKKFIKEHTNIAIIVVSVLIFILIIIAIILISKSSNKNKEMLNEYYFEERVVELRGTKVISNDQLKAEHCIENVCVSNVTVYSTEKEGRVECTVTNKTKDIIKNGYLKLKLGDKTLIINYRDVTVGDSTKATTQFKGFSLQNVSDYTVEKLTKEEKQSIYK